MKAGKQENAEESLRTLASNRVGWQCFIVDLCSAKNLQEINQVQNMLKEVCTKKHLTSNHKLKKAMINLYLIQF